MSEHTNERTETHACDSISRQKAIDTVKKMRAVCDTDSIEDYEALLETAFEALPFAQPETEERTAELVQNVSDSDLIFRKAAIDAVTNGMCSGYDCEVIEALEYLPSAQPEQRYTEEELRVFQHGISLSLLSKRSSQHWQYDEDTATEIKFLERLYEKVVADMRGEQDGRFNQQAGGD